MKNTLFLLSFLCLVNFSVAQEKQEDFDIIRASLYYPYAPKLRKIKVAIIVQTYKFPEPWLEGAYSVPFINLQGRIPLKKNFTAQFNLGTIIASNQLSVGFRWNKQFDSKFAFNIGYDFAVVFGGLTIADFDTRVAASIHYPNFAFSYRYKDVAFTIKSELNIVGDVKIWTGENVTTGENNFYNGFTVGLYMEQRLWKNHVIILGLKNHYTKFSYIAWPAFSTFNRFYNIPEISIGLVL